MQGVPGGDFELHIAAQQMAQFAGYATNRGVNVLDMHLAAVRLVCRITRLG